MAISFPIEVTKRADSCKASSYNAITLNKSNTNMTRLTNCVNTYNTNTNRGKTLNINPCISCVKQANPFNLCVLYGKT